MITTNQTTKKDLKNTIGYGEANGILMTLKRASERSRIISPALQQAVESNVAELEEATFGRGQFFDIKDDVTDTQKQDISILKKNLMKTLKCAKCARL